MSRIAPRWMSRRSGQPARRPARAAPGDDARAGCRRVSPLQRPQRPLCDRRLRNADLEQHDVRPLRPRAGRREAHPLRAPQLDAPLSGDRGRCAADARVGVLRRHGGARGDLRPRDGRRDARARRFEPPRRRPAGNARVPRPPARGHRDPRLGSSHDASARGQDARGDRSPGAQRRHRDGDAGPRRPRPRAGGCRTRSRGHPRGGPLAARRRAPRDEHRVLGPEHQPLAGRGDRSGPPGRRPGLCRHRLGRRRGLLLLRIAHVPVRRSRPRRPRSARSTASPTTGWSRCGR